MKFINNLSAVFAITLLISLGIVAIIPQAKASPDENQVVSEEESTTDDFPAETETFVDETCVEKEAQEIKTILNPQLVELGLDNPSSLDSNGSILIPEDGTILDICLPESLGEVALNTIAPNAFVGTDCLRSITLPSSITTIGENAFANCPNLAYIVLMDRFDLEGLILEENWNGDATIVFGLVQEETSSTESTQVPVESSEPYQELLQIPTSESVDIDTTSSEDKEDLNLEDSITE